MKSEISDPLKQLSEVFKPDERQEFLPQSLEYIHSNLSALTLHERVPVGVQQLFETAKNARLYTYCVYRFHQLAEMTAYLALERALKERWNSEIARLPSIDEQDFDAPGLSELLAIAVARGWIRKEEFSSRRYRAYLRTMSQRSSAAILAMQKSGAEEQPIAEPSEDEVSSAAEHIDVARLLAEHLPDLRNQLAHGSARLSPTSDLVLSDVRDAINMIFDGRPPIDSPADKQAKQPGLHGIFKAHLRDLEVKRRELLSMQPTTRDTLPRDMPTRGVYLLSEAGRHLYVGRSNGIRKRIGRHCRLSAKHNMASFAFRLAKEKLGIGRATYRKGQARSDVANQELFAKEFAAAKVRIRAMQVRYVEERDPIRQALLEIYVSLVHGTPYNDFDTH